MDAIAAILFIGAGLSACTAIGLAAALYGPNWLALMGDREEPESPVAVRVNTLSTRD